MSKRFERNSQLVLKVFTGRFGFRAPTAYQSKRVTELYRNPFFTKKRPGLVWENVFFNRALSMELQVIGARNLMN